LFARQKSRRSFENLFAFSLVPIAFFASKAATVFLFTNLAKNDRDSRLGEKGILKLIGEGELA
jgi:hypothetical protein